VKPRLAQFHASHYLSIARRSRAKARREGKNAEYQIFANKKYSAYLMPLCYNRHRVPPNKKYGAYLMPLCYNLL